MKKEEIIAKYGEGEYKRQLEQRREYHKEHKEEDNARSKEYYEEHPEQVIADSHEQSRKDGRRYDKTLEYNRTGIQGERNKIRSKHRGDYKPYKDIIAPDSQIHHEWLPRTAEYRGVALVEANPHRYGIIDVIEILDGEITLLTEEEIRKKQIKKSG